MRIGDPEGSLLIQTLRRQKKVAAMPPGEPLPMEVIAHFEEWVRRGLVDPRDGVRIAKSSGMSLEEGKRFWSFVPPAISANHQNRATSAVVDALVQAELAKRALAANGPADQAQLLRRISFDLVGLPPTVEEIDAFLEDTGPDSYAKVVDRLLDSPRFGERSGRHWLDVVRYADSNGRDGNVLWYHAWRYRDYVIDSMNRDVPINRFLREQIAGDLLPYSSNEERDRLRIATGFWALESKAFEEQKPEIFRMDVIDEQLDVVGRAILGLSIACARCHDHKFDPIPTRDYYALAGILRSSQLLYGLGPTGIKATMHNHTPLWPIGPDAESLGPKGLAFLEHVDKLSLIQNNARSDRYRIVRRLADVKLQLAKPGADQAAIQKTIDQLSAEIKAWDVKVKAAETELKYAMDPPPARVRHGHSRTGQSRGLQDPYSRRDDKPRGGGAARFSRSAAQPPPQSAWRTKRPTSACGLADRSAQSADSTRLCQSGVAASVRQGNRGYA